VLVSALGAHADRLEDVAQLWERERLWEAATILAKVGDVPVMVLTVPCSAMARTWGRQLFVTSTATVCVPAPTALVPSTLVGAAVPTVHAH